MKIIIKKGSRVKCIVSKSRAKRSRQPPSMSLPISQSGGKKRKREPHQDQQKKPFQVLKRRKRCSSEDVTSENDIAPAPRRMAVKRRHQRCLPTPWRSLLLKVFDRLALEISKLNILGPMVTKCCFLSPLQDAEDQQSDMTTEDWYRSFYSAVPILDNPEKKSKHPEVTQLFTDSIKSARLQLNKSCDMDIRPALKGFSFLVDHHAQSFQVDSVMLLKKSFLNWSKDYIYLKYIVPEHGFRAADAFHSKWQGRHLASKFLSDAFGEQPTANQQKFKEFLGQYPSNANLSRDAVHFLRKAFFTHKFQQEHEKKPYWIKNYSPLPMKQGFSISHVQIPSYRLYKILLQEMPSILSEIFCFDVMTAVVAR